MKQYDDLDVFLMPTKINKRTLESKPGRRKEEYDRLFKEQNGRCAICGKHQDEVKRKLCIDHDHVTKKTRGLLCSQCNSMLGMAHDDQTVLRVAIEYLQRNGTLNPKDANILITQRINSHFGQS